MVGTSTISDGEMRKKNSFFDRFKTKRTTTEDSSVQTGSGKSRSSFRSRKSKSKASSVGHPTPTIAEHEDPSMNMIVTPDKLDKRDHSGRDSPNDEPRDPSGDKAFSSYGRKSRVADPHGKYISSYNSKIGEAYSSPDRKKHRQARVTGNRDPNEYIAPPPAREAAFAGPPRFDWIDVETAAATKIQSVVRKNQAMSAMESKGMTTSAIRNRRRRRRAAMKNRQGGGGRFISVSEDAPSIFSCCALGLAFGDATEEDDGAYRIFQKKQYEERQKQQSAHEAALRKRYMKNGLQSNQKVMEAVEVVEEY